MNTNSIFTSIDQLPDFVHKMNEYAFENANVQKLIHSTNLHFDVVINEEFFADSFLMFAHKFKAPVITMCEYLRKYFDFCEVSLRRKGSSSTPLISIFV